MEERPLPRTSQARAIAVVLTFSTACCLAVWLAIYVEMEWLAGVPFIAAVPFGYYFFWVRTCPECGRRLAEHSEPLNAPTRFRVLSRCEQCQIDWDTGVVHDTRYDD